MTRVEIRDVAPRDGLQDHDAIVPTQRKAELVRSLLAAGVRNVEVTSFVSPSRVPQLADAPELLGLLEAEERSGATLSAFVATEDGAQRALAAGADELSVAVPATDGMSEANFRRTSRRMLEELVAMRHEHARTAMSATVAVAFGCPFDGPVPEHRVLAIVERLAEAGYETIFLGDTVGVANPRQVEHVYTLLRERVPAVVLGAHFHDPRGAGVANVVAAVDAGATVVDAALAGLGGCPFASGAAGNVATEDVVWTLEAMGFELDPDPDCLADAARRLADDLGVELRSRTPQAKRFDWERDAIGV